MIDEMITSLHDAGWRGFASDNYAGVHPEVLAALATANGGHQVAYGEDVYTARLQEVVRAHFGPRAEAFPVFNGTGANVDGRKAREGGAEKHDAHEDGTGSGAGDGHGKGKGNGSGAHHEGAPRTGGADHHGDALEHEHAEILEAKQHGWLAKNFWYVRAVGYFVV